MNYTSFQNKEFNKISLETFKCSDEYCAVSVASNEIMLDRFYNGKRIEFPFAP